MGGEVQARLDAYEEGFADGIGLAMKVLEARHIAWARAKGRDPSRYASEMSLAAADLRKMIVDSR